MRDDLTDETPEEEIAVEYAKFATEFTIWSDPNRPIDTITVVRRSQRDDINNWAISNGTAVFNRHGEWEREPMPSNRDTGFFERCRYTLWQAIWIAEQLAEVRQQKNQTK